MIWEHKAAFNILFVGFTHDESQVFSKLSECVKGGCDD